MNNFKLKYLLLIFVVFFSFKLKSHNENSIYLHKDSLNTFAENIFSNEKLDFNQKIKSIDDAIEFVLNSDSANIANYLMRSKTFFLYNNSKFEEGIKNEHEIIKFSKKYNYKEEIIASRNNLNILHYRLGNLDSALYYLNLNFDDLKDSNNSFSKSANLNGLVIYYLKAENYEKAFYYNTLLEELGTKENKIESLQSAYFNWVTYYKDLDRYDKAIDFANKYLENQPNNFSMLVQLGLIYKRQEKYDKSIEIYKRTLGVISPENLYALAAVNNNIGVAYNLKEEYAKAIPYLEKGLSLSEEAKANSYIEVALDQLTITYKGLKDFEKGLYYTEKYYEHVDSIKSIEVQERIASLENTAELNEKNAELQLAETEKLLKESELNAKNKQILIGFFVLIIVIGFLAYAVILNRKLQHTKVALEISNNTKDKFFSIIAHDLRSPIIALQGIGKRLTKHIVQQNFERVERLAPELDKSLGNVNFLLNNLLNWAVSQQGNIPIKMEKIDVSEIIQEVVSSVEIMAKAKAVTIKMQIDKFEVEADYNSLSLILRNLLSNAIKFSPENGEVTIIAKNNNQKSIEIIDQGIGIGEEQLEKINKAIYFSDANQMGEKGFGIGLNLVHQFANMNKIKLNIDSQIDKGSRFSVIFNL
jgi:signal transduction histidine kinase